MAEAVAEVQEVEEVEAGPVSQAIDAKPRVAAAKPKARKKAKA